MESAKSEAAQVQPDTGAQAARADAERNMTKAVSALTNLPAGMQAKAEAARQALYDYMKADESGKAAAYSKAMEQLRKSISSALEAKGLDKWTRQRLEGILDNIDSKGEMGDNKDNALILATRFVNRMDPLWKNADKIKPIEGYEDIVCHGDTISLIFKDSKGNETNLSALKFSRILKKSPNYKGGPIRLIACKAGAEGSIVAQTIADQLGVEVLAPTDTVFVFPDGTMVVGPEPWDNIGIWKIYKPRGK